MPRQLRNIGIMAHVDAGKTTCAERILFLAGRIRKTGEVHDGNTRLDFHPIERKKGITIKAAATTAGWTPSSGPFAGTAHVVSLVDTPGHVDFTIEVERSLRVLDGAIFVLDGASGVECQSETVFRQAAHHEVPCIAFVNKMDKPGADFDACLADIEDKLAITAVPVQLPLVIDGRLVVADVLTRELVVESDGGRKAERRPLPAEAVEAVERMRARVFAAAAEHDDVVMEAFVSHRDPSAVELALALRKGVLARDLLVVTCGAALDDIGIGPLLDAVVTYLPSPEERRPCSEDDPFAALVFKSTHDRMAGLVTWLRVYSGTLRAGDAVLVMPRRVRERVGRIFIPDADGREDVDVVRAGSIVCVTGLDGVRTGETLSDPRSPLSLDAIRIPDPVVSVVIEPKTAQDRDRLGPALAKLVACDPSLRARVDEESGQTVLSGMGKLHLDIQVDILASDYGVTVTTGRPHVAYRETIGREATATYRHKKQSGGVGQFAVVTLVVTPGERGTGILFVDETKGGVVPKDFLPGVERGILGAAERGVFTGHPVVDVVVSLTDGEAHVKDSSAIAFEIAASHAFREAVRSAGLVVLEPVALVEVVAPEAHTGDVLGELASRRASVRDVAPREGRGLVTVRAKAPVATMFDFVPRLRALTHGRGEAMTRPEGYDVAPNDVARALLEKA
ncbi:MAG: elongation factor G [Deltaproteobacteria bacterium]|nr:elongation factor G [Deltaproteobacteria bacterium]